MARLAAVSPTNRHAFHEQHGCSAAARLPRHNDVFLPALTRLTVVSAPRAFHDKNGLSCL
jgi:hypothetical protein